MLEPTPGTAIFGYFGSVAAATLIFAAATMLRDVMAHRPDPFRPDLLEVRAIIAVIYGVVTTFAALLPCLAAERLAALLQVRTAWYFALWGAATGLALGPCVLALNRGLATDSPPPMPDLWVDRYALTFSTLAIRGGLDWA